MNVLVDHNLKGYIVLLQGTLVSDGWLDLLSIRFVTLEEAGLAIDSSDRIIWRFAQVNQMLLLTSTGNIHQFFSHSFSSRLKEEKPRDSLLVRKQVETARNH